MPTSMAMTTIISDALSEYSDLPNYDPQRNRNIEEAYNLLTR